MAGCQENHSEKNFEWWKDASVYSLVIYLISWEDKDHTCFIENNNMGWYRIQIWTTIQVHQIITKQKVFYVYST